ncbi:MAG: integrase [Spartobacteria bacterium]|nr:integrase [Spartobacteria bacterium]
MNITFSYLVSTFFTSYLITEQGLSQNTVASYSDCMKLLIDYICKCFSIETEAIDIKKINYELVLDFLDSLEKGRHNSQETRNQRLAAIKSFSHFLSRKIPDLMHQNERIQAIKFKKTAHRSPPSLTVEEITAIIAAPDPETFLGARDKALIQLLHNTGARVQEIADLNVSDINIESALITLTGKGKKTRVLPLWKETIEHILYALKAQKQKGIESDHLFLNNKGLPITRFGIGRLLTKHVEVAAKQCPSLIGRKISPHVFRHTTALHLIESGNDVALVRDWLGHADIKTTIQYIEVSVERKREALEKLPPPDGNSPPEKPKWKQPDLMDFLTELSRKGYYVA